MDHTALRADEKVLSIAFDIHQRSRQRKMVKQTSMLYFTKKRKC